MWLITIMAVMGDNRGSEALIHETSPRSIRWTLLAKDNLPICECLTHLVDHSWVMFKWLSDFIHKRILAFKSHYHPDKCGMEPCCFINATHWMCATKSTVFIPAENTCTWVHGFHTQQSNSLTRTLSMWQLAIVTRSDLSTTIVN